MSYIIDSDFELKEEDIILSREIESFEEIGRFKYLIKSKEDKYPEISDTK